MKTVSKLTFIVGLLTASQTYAQEGTLSKFFVAGELGIAQHSIDVSGAGANYEPEDGNATSPSLAFGYNFNDNFSIAAQYTDYNEADLFDVDTVIEGTPVNIAFSTETSGFSVVGQYSSARYTGGWYFSGKLGLMKWNTDVNVKYSGNFPSFVESDSDSGIAIYGGLMAAYAVADNMDVTIGADWFVNDLDFELIEGAQTDMQYSRFSVGLKYYW